MNNQTTNPTINVAAAILEAMTPSLIVGDWHTLGTIDCANERRSCKPIQFQGMQERLFLNGEAGIRTRVKDLTP
jgi:hypothetical protein